MKLLEERISKDGRILPGDVLKVDSFLNQQLDVALLSECGKEWYRLFKDEGITKILTIEASGIGIACVTAQYFGVPVVFAKKSKGAGVSPEFLSTKVTSFTHGHTYDVTVNKKFISANDKILVIDDFLANASALKALITVAELGGAKVVGAGVAIEKVFQGGGDTLRAKGYRIESLARIASISIDSGIEFC
jgi:xanthine phosphoribosyltransferase